MKLIPWVELSRETVFQKYGHKLDKVIFRLPSGAESDYYLSGHNVRLAAVFALTKDNKVILAEQFRPGPQKFIKELPGGVVEGDEDPTVAIKREFLEETGYTGDFELITQSVVDAYSGAVRYHFVAKNCRKVQEPSNSDAETTNIILMDIPEFKAHLRTGQLSDIDTGYFGLDRLRLL